MQCDLEWFRSFRCEFPLEPFTRGLASELAYQHAQRFVTMIARCSSSHSASILPTALISGPDHHAPWTPRILGGATDPSGGIASGLDMRNRCARYAIHRTWKERATKGRRIPATSSLSCSSLQCAVRSNRISAPRNFRSWAALRWRSPRPGSTGNAHQHSSRTPSDSAGDSRRRTGPRRMTCNGWRPSS
jgi:hypothetical protein